MSTQYLILAGLFVTALFIRTGYELLKEAKKADPGNKRVFAIIFGVMCMLWMSWFSLCTLDPILLNLPSAVRWAGLAMFAGGMILAFRALFQLRGLENIDHLVTSGLFARLRHPMYTGFMLWTAGWSLLHDAVLSLLVGLPGIANILYWRRLEDKRLLAQFGDTYRRYSQRTWF